MSEPLPSDGLLALPVAEAGCALRRLSRRGMGRAGVRRPRAVREAGARRFPGRACRGSPSCASARISARPSTTSSRRTSRATPSARSSALMDDAGIVRNRAKIEGADLSARGYLDIMEKGPGFSALLWDFVGGKPQINHRRRIARRAGRDAGLARDVQGAVGARLQVRRADHRLRLHAGGRHGQRPPGHLPSSSRRAAAAPQDANLTHLGKSCVLRADLKFSLSAPSLPRDALRQRRREQRRRCLVP